MRKAATLVQQGFIYYNIVRVTSLNGAGLSVFYKKIDRSLREKHLEKK